MSQHDNPTAWWHSDKPARHILRHEDGSETELSESDLDAMMRRWDQAVREQGKKSVIDEEHQLRVQVAEAAMGGIKAAVLSGELPEEIHDFVVLEALLLTMQMVGGPQATATVLRYSFDIFAVK
jgi:hypothetical protein